MWKEFKYFNNNIKVRLISDFLQKLANNLFYTFLAVFLANIYNLQMVSSFIIIITGIIIFSSLIGGYLSDAFGRRKIILISENIRLLSFLGILLLMLSSTSELSYLIIIFIMIDSFGGGLGGAANESIIIDSSTDKNRKEIYSISYWLLNFAATFGSLIGAFLFSENLLTLIIIITICLLINLTISLLFLKDVYSFKQNKINNYPTISNTIKNILSSYIKVLKSKMFLMFIAGSIIVFGTEAQLTNFISVRLDRDFESVLNLFNKEFFIDGVKVLGILKAINTIIVVFFSGIILNFTNKFKNNKTIVIGILLFFIGYAFVSSSNNFTILILSTVLFSVGEIIYAVPRQVIIAKLTEVENRSKFMALNSLSIRLSLLLGGAGLYLIYLNNILIFCIFILAGILSVLLHQYTLNRLIDK